jgi:hypothetical protein
MDLLADLNTFLCQHCQEHHAIFDNHVSQKPGILALCAKWMNAGVADQCVERRNE